MSIARHLAQCIAPLREHALGVGRRTVDRRDRAWAPFPAAALWLAPSAVATPATELTQRVSWWSWISYIALAALLLGVLIWQAWRRLRLEAQVADVVRTSERRLESALRGSGDGLWDWDRRRGTVFRSHVDRMLGWESGSLPEGEDFLERYVHPDDRERMEQAMADHLAGDADRYEVEIRMKAADGSWRWVLDRGTTVERSADGRPQRVAGTFRDISRSKRAEEELRVWSTVFESLGEGVVVVGADDRVQAVNPAYSRMTGFESAELVGRRAQALGVAGDLAPTWPEIRAVVEREGRWQGEALQARSQGGAFLAALDVTTVRDESGAGGRFVVVVVDITRRKESEEELRYLASYDTLTELPNRAMFQQQMEVALAQASEQSSRLALLFGDLDRFKRVNDTLGHVAGDLLLQEASGRLLASVRDRDLVARLGGDEFTVVLEEVSDLDVVERVAQRVLEAFNRPFFLEGQEVAVTTSLGIALYPDHGEDTETLLKHADVAMYAAKASGRDRFRIYESEMSHAVLERMTLENRLRRAVDADELELWYQPQIDLENGALRGVECLLRWRRDGELLSPAAFLDVAEETGLILELGAWVLETACHRGADWNRRFGLDISVNVSPMQLDDPHFVELVQRCLDESRLEPGRLTLEITESMLMDDVDASIERLHQLTELGVRLALDDFGTGFSSLGYLERLPIHVLKVDRSFVRELGTGEAPIFYAVLGMAKGLGLDVVAEGVETEEQMRVLYDEACCVAQGYFLSPPRPGEELEESFDDAQPPWSRWLETSEPTAPTAVSPEPT